MSKKDKNIKVQYQVDLDNLNMIGKVQEGNSNTQINHGINKAILKAFDSLMNWTMEYEALVKDNKDEEAFEILEKNKGSIRFSSKSILGIILKLNFKNLPKPKRKDFLVLSIAIAANENGFGKVESQIDYLLKEYKDVLDNELYSSIILSKANASATNRKFNTANINYKAVIESNHSSSIDKGYAYRGLSKISPYPDDSIKQEEFAVDKFLESGKINEAIKDIVHLAKQYQKSDPEHSIELIDKAISLYDEKDSLNREYKASLYHNKATYLYTINRNNEALENADKACQLREGLIGNEHERFSSLSLALSLSNILKLKDKAFNYQKEIDEVIPTILSEDFSLEQKFQKYFNGTEKINLELINEIEATANVNLKFSLYLLISVQEEFSFSEKMEYLDKANLLIQEKTVSNQHIALYYFSVAELFRTNDKIDDAISEYEKSLTYNPFHLPSIQNCGAILWNNKKWDTAIKFFKARIKELGESSTLLYCLGRSFFENNQFQPAFDNFKKITTSIDGVDIKKYINECVEKSDELNLSKHSEVIQQDVIITLDSFNKALEEFSKTISTNSRMDFWKQESGKYKWTPSPEEKAKHYLITGLEMKFGKDSIDIIQERRAGAGIIDLHVFLRGGLKVVIELKICGSPGYSSTYALSGKDQVIHYMENTGSHFGFLLIFDARKRDFGKGFKKIQSFGNNVIQTHSIDLRPTINK